MNLKFWKKSEDKSQIYLLYSLNSNKRDCDDLEKRLEVKGVKTIVTFDHIMKAFAFDCEEEK